jgi:uncharacterized protein DUF1980
VDRSLLAFLGGLALSIAAPRSVALVSTSPAVTLCAAATLTVIAYRGARSNALYLALASGAFAGVWIAGLNAPAVRGVEARAPRIHGAADLFDALDALDADPSAIEGRVISVSGTWTPSHDGWAPTVSRRIMTCCAADAVDVGFDVEPRAGVRVTSGAWVRVTGRVRANLRDGDVRYEIADAEVMPAI